MWINIVVGLLMLGCIIFFVYHNSKQRTQIETFVQKEADRQAKILDMIDTLDIDFDKAPPIDDKRPRKRTLKEISAHSLRWSIGLIPDEEYAFYKKPRARKAKNDQVQASPRGSDE